MNKTHKKRLLNLIRALEESPNPKGFSMRDFGDGCGTPMCVLGHYAARKDLQRAFGLDPAVGESLLVNRRGTVFYSHWSKEVEEHFGLKGSESETLFGGWGCGGAKTIPQAIRFIKRFIKKKERQ